MQRFRRSRHAVDLGSLGVAPEDALSLSEIARLYGVTRNSAHRYARRADFPEPLTETSAGRVWLRRDVERWGKAHLPLQTGRPRKLEGKHGEEADRDR
jgi:predicted DNA-binding transcriptional regulator AlpA